MIKFYFQYDRDKHKAKVVVSKNGKYDEETTFFTDQVDCRVHTITKKQDDNPKFVVEGECSGLIVMGNKIIIQ